MTDKLFTPNMDTIKPYRAAPQLQERSFRTRCMLRIDCSIAFIKFIILSIPICIELVKNFFKPAGRKQVGGKLAVVTGGGNGLGREIVLRLAKEGCNIIVIDIDGEAAVQTASDASNFGIKTRGVKLDVADREGLRKLVVSVEEEFGPIEILINNAAIIPSMSILEGRPEDIERVISVNVTAHFWTIRAFFDTMVRRRRGHIVAINSICGLEGITNILYTTTKYATRGLMESLTAYLRELKLENEVFTTIAYPSFINTRCEVVDKFKALGFTNKIEPVEPEFAADEIVDGILANQTTIFVPKINGFLFCLLKVLPAKLKSLLFDLLRE